MNITEELDTLHKKHTIVNFLIKLSQKWEVYCDHNDDEDAQHIEEEIIHTVNMLISATKQLKGEPKIKKCLHDENVFLKAVLKDIKGARTKHKEKSYFHEIIKLFEAIQQLEARELRIIEEEEKLSKRVA